MPVTMLQCPEKDPNNTTAMGVCQVSAIVVAGHSSDPNKKNEMLSLAEQMLSQLVKKDDVKYAFNMACVCALRKDEDGCRKWLELANEHGNLAYNNNYFLLNNFFGEFANKEWFKKLKWTDPPIWFFNYN